MKDFKAKLRKILTVGLLVGVGAGSLMMPGQAEAGKLSNVWDSVTTSYAQKLTGALTGDDCMGTTRSSYGNNGNSSSGYQTCTNNKAREKQKQQRMAQLAQQKKDRAADLALRNQQRQQQQAANLQARQQNQDARAIARTCSKAFSDAVRTGKEPSKFQQRACQGQAGWAQISSPSGPG